MREKKHDIKLKYWTQPFTKTSSKCANNLYLLTCSSILVLSAIVAASLYFNKQLFYGGVCKLTDSHIAVKWFWKVQVL